MTVFSVIRQKIKESQGKSFALLAERTDKTSVAPHGIKVAENISPEETAVLVLGGFGGQGVHLRGYNGYLKKTDEFIKTHPELQGKNVRVCVAVCYIGSYYDEKIIQKCMYDKRMLAKACTKDIADMYREETLNPGYIRDIFNAAFLPRISRKGGTERLPAEQASRNIRRLNIITHCHGSYDALCLEQMMLEKMSELGYAPSEQRKVVRNLLVLNYAPVCAQDMAKSQFISIESAADDHNRYQTDFKEYLQMKSFDFGLIRMPKQNGNILMCTKIDKSGIEGNPPKVVILRPVTGDEIFNRPKAGREKKDEPRKLGEHEFLGFKKVANMSNGAVKMQSFANNILKNAVLNSLAQNKEKAVPLPPLRKLACDTPEQYAEFSRAYLKGWQLTIRCIHSNQKKLAAFIRYHQAHRVELS